MRDPYTSPDASVDNEPDLGNFRSMPRIHTLLVILLLIGSLGLYMPYWAITRAQRFNVIYPHGVVSLNFTWIVSLIYFLSSAMDVIDLASAFSGNSLELATNYKTFYLMLAFSASLGFLVWVFHFRSRMNTFLVQELNNNFSTAGIVLTFFFGIVYLNFKINQTLDDLQEASQKV